MRRDLFLESIIYVRGELSPQFISECSNAKIVEGGKIKS
jgi:hypothetical protein